ncbi:hypothetical protein AURDEDRAFT_109482 [Auricularia subglabra TFB-10046 SS5]|nr:hypothetical protein AURDEDRAFT_109482 [Auricularia subglabra TFB-10046 SS5]
MSLSARLREYDALHSRPASDTSSLSPSTSSASLDSIQEEAAPSQPPRIVPTNLAYGAFCNAPKGTSQSSLRHCIGEPEPQPLRKFEQLAVVIDRSLWKRDADARQCDIWNCDTVFTLFERRHHCRHCGGVFCAAHSSRTTSLLDTTRSPTPMLALPRGKPITAFASPQTPVIPDARVCDGCHDFLHGIPTWPAASCSTSPTSAKSMPLPSTAAPTAPAAMRVRRRARSPPSSASASPLAATPPDGQAPVSRIARRHSTAPSPTPTTAHLLPARSNSVVYFAVPGPIEPPKPAPRDMLIAYPLHEHSSQCKRRASDRRRLQQQQQRFA